MSKVDKLLDVILGVLLVSIIGSSLSLRAEKERDVSDGQTFEEYYQDYENKKGTVYNGEEEWNEWNKNRDRSHDDDDSWEDRLGTDEVENPYKYQVGNR